MAVSHLILSALGAVSGSGGGGVVIAASTKGHGADTATTGTITTANGGLLLAFVNVDPTVSALTFSGTYTNSWSRESSTIGTKQLHVYSVHNCVGGAGHSITVTPTPNTGTAPSVTFIYITGANTSSAIELYAETSDASSPYDTTITTSSSGRLLIGCINTTDDDGGDNNYSASSWTKIQEEQVWSSYYTQAVFSQDASTAGTYPMSVVDANSQTVSADLAIFAVHA